MKFRISLSLSGVVLILLISAASLIAGEFLIVANPGVQQDGLDRDVISDIFRGDKTKWDNGSKISVIMLKEGAVHLAFVQEILGTTPEKIRDLWKKAVFTGIGTPPKILKTEQDVIKTVAETEGAVGYVGESAPHEGVKIISVR